MHQFKRYEAGCGWEAHPEGLFVLHCDAQEALEELRRQSSRPEWDPTPNAGCQQGHPLIEFHSTDQGKDCPLCQFIEALTWCSGSPDFGPGGQAHEGWMKVCHPLIHPKP